MNPNSHDQNQVTLTGTIAGKFPAVVMGDGERRMNFTLLVAAPAGVTNYIPIVCWNLLAGKAEGLADGSDVEVRGAIRKTSWTNSSGQKRSRLEVVADSLAGVDR